MTAHPNFGAAYPCLIRTSPATGSNGASAKSTNVGAIAGGVIGGVAGLCLLIGLFVWLVRRQQPQKSVDVSPYPVLPVTNSHSSNSLKNSPVVGPETVQVDVPSTPAGMHHKGAPAGPATARIPVSAPATAISTSPPSSMEPPTVASVESSSGPAQMESMASSSTAAVQPVVPVAPTVSVDHIIELIAQRIDRGPPRALADEDDAPPRYPESMIQ